MNAEKIKECREYCAQSLERGRKSAMFSVEEVTALLDEVEALTAALAKGRRVPLCGEMPEAIVFVGEDAAAIEALAARHEPKDAEHDC